jgi:multidrug efflux pump subunit AcrA (membrane-fusion protein)
MLDTGTQVNVTAPAIPDATFAATVHYVGREVIADTNAVRLVATIGNPDGILRPGMFVRVSLPVGAPQAGLAVSPEAILRQGEEEFVFVKLADDTFQKMDVDTGAVSDEWVEVKQGLSAGQHVVRRGSFLLKSELLLEGEEE